eukprot:TRINITY_DN1192_c0_g1_i3.p1 TRINITY_DN1192_c0_g1~~TRINITY_DN1192_c0_g1_i3.p1  ORF type:complete len:1332 (-),score=661.94 TRINITY_DN1192_c0_g1_i3:39-4034(-)
MSSSGQTTVVQAEITKPSLEQTLHNLNPLESDDPLIKSLVHGEIPSNKVLDQAIDKARDSLEETRKEGNMSSKGEQLIQDATEVLDAAQRLIDQRNKGDKVQHLIKDGKAATQEVVQDISDAASNAKGAVKGAVKDAVKSVLPSPATVAATALSAASSVASGASSAAEGASSAASSLANSVASGAASVMHNGIPSLGELGHLMSESLNRKLPNLDLPSGGEIGGDAKEAYQCGRELLLTAISSSEFRAFLNEFADFFQGAFLGTKETLSEIGGAVKMDIDQGNATLDNTASTLKDTASDAKDSLVNAKPIEWSQNVRDQYYDRFSVLLNEIHDKPEYKRLLDLYWKWTDALREKASKVAEAAKEKAGEIKEQAMEKASQLADKASEAKDMAIDKAAELKDKAVDKAAEIKDQAVEKVSEMKDDALEKAYEAKEIAKDKANDVKDVTMKDANDAASSIERVWNDLKGLLDSFAGEGSFDTFYGNWWLLFDQMYNDKEASQYLSDLRSFMSAAITDPSSLKDKAVAQEGGELLERGRNLVQSKKWTAKFNETVDYGRNMIHNIATDSLANDFASKLRKFGEHLVLDEQGRPDLYVIQDSLSQLRQFIFPLVARNLSSFSIDRVLGETEDYHWSIENLVVSITDLMPESFELLTKNRLAVNVKDFGAQKNITKVVLDVTKLKPAFNGVKFWYKRKSFPHLEDAGTADVDLSGGDGTRVKIVWKIKSKANRPFSFSLMEVKCVIDKMDIKVKDAKHDILDRLATSLFGGSIKHAVAHGIVNKLVELLQPLNDQMNNWFVSRPIGSLVDKLNDSVHLAFDEGNKLIQSHPIDRTIEAATRPLIDAKDKLVSAKDTAMSGYNFAKEVASELKDKAAEKASELKDDAMDVSENVKESASKALEKGSELKDAAMEKGAELAEKAKEKLPELKEKASELAGQALEKGTELKDQAMKKGGELADKAKEKLPELKEKASDLAAQALEKGGELKDQAADLADKAMKKGGELKEQAADVAGKAAKKGAELKDQAMEKGSELADKAKEKLPELKEKAAELKDQAGDLANKAAKKGGELKDQAMEKGSELADKAKEKLPELKEKASDLADKAAKKGAELKEGAEDMADKAAANASEMAEKASKKGGELKDAAVKKAGELKDKAPEKVQKAADKAIEKGSELADKAGKKASELKDEAMEKGSELADEAGKKLNKAAKKGAELKDEAMEKGSELADKAAKKGGELKEGAEDAAEEVADKAIHLRDAAVNKAVSYKDAVLEKASDAMEVDPTTGLSAAPSSSSGKSQWTGSWQKPKRKVRSQTLEGRPSKKAAAADGNPYEALSELNAK